MSKYYCLVAGLPDITLEDSKLAYSVSEFKDELQEHLTTADKKLINLFFLKYDNENIVLFLKDQEAMFDNRGSISKESLDDFLQALKHEEKHPLQKTIPPYMMQFFLQYLAQEEKEGEQKIAWRDRLNALYYAYAGTCKNAFVRAWFELNLNINNLLTAITCRKYDLEKADYIVGENEVAKAIRSSNARDFGLGDSIDYLPTLLRIAEETDLMQREKKIDMLRWQWLEENTFFKTFDIEKVFAYLMQVEMIERWVALDKETGEQTFRKLVGSMKKGSVNTLEEFKKNTNK